MPAGLQGRRRGAFPLTGNLIVCQLTGWLALLAREPTSKNAEILRDTRSRSCAGGSLSAALLAGSRDALCADPAATQWDRAWAISSAPGAAVKPGHQQHPGADLGAWIRVSRQAGVSWEDEQAANLWPLVTVTQPPYSGDDACWGRLAAGRQRGSGACCA
jgi:hypothetical protein